MVLEVDVGVGRRGRAPNGEDGIGSGCRLCMYIGT